MMTALEDFNACKLGRALVAIARERDRQDELVNLGVHPFSCSDPAIHGFRKLPVLAEEFGEVGKALYEFDNEIAIGPAALQALRTELIQLAAVACAWAESLPDSNS